MQYNNESASQSTESTVENNHVEIEIDETIEYDESNPQVEDESKNSRFKEGEKITMIRVRFPGNAKSFPFYLGKKRFAYGQKVVAMSDRGMTVGYINSFPYEIEFNKSMLPIRSIAKVANDDDIKAQKDFRDSEKKAEVVCLRLIEKYKLDMVLTHVEFIQFGKKAVFYFNAPERVDFRDLVKDLVADLKMRIELRQISVRDRAAALGAVGACGLQTCCSSFLKNYGNVSIKMAKNQNLALIPSKLNGVCGQIKCCIKYEDDVYADKRKLLPKEGTIIRAKNGDIGKVLKLHLLVEQFELLTDFGAKRRYAGVEFIGEENLPENYKFPETFDHIVDETKEVIGLIKEAQKRADQFIDEMEDDEDDLYLDDGSDNDDDYEDDDDVNSSSIEDELKDIEGTLKSSANIQQESMEIVKASQQVMRENNRHHNNNNQQRHHNNNQQRDNRNDNRNNQNRSQNNNTQGNQGNRDNRNNNRNFKPRNNNQGNQSGNNQNNNQNQQRSDRPNQNRDNRNDNRNNQNQNRNNHNRNNNQNRNFKPRHNNNNQPRPQGENRSNHQQNNKEDKKPE